MESAHQQLQQQQNPSGEDSQYRNPAHGSNVLLKVTTGASTLALFCGGLNEDVCQLVSGLLTAAALWNPAVPGLEMVLCFIGDEYWPVGKDSTVIRVGTRRFCFCLPGLLYGLTLPDSCTDDELRKLEEILMTFSAYENRAGAQGYEVHAQEPEKDFWANAYSTIMDIAEASANTHSALTSTGEAEAQPPMEEEAPETELEVMLCRALKVNRASRFSIITRLVGRALMKGLLTQRRVRVKNTPSALWPAVASVRTVSDVLDLADLVLFVNFRCSLPERNRCFPSGAGNCWMLEEAGLLLILRLVVARGLLKSSMPSSGAGGGES